MVMFAVEIKGLYLAGSIGVYAGFLGFWGVFGAISSATMVCGEFPVKLSCCFFVCYRSLFHRVEVPNGEALPFGANTHTVLSHSGVVVNPFDLGG